MKNSKKKSIETTLWQSADKLRKNMAAAEYKHVVLGLIFLKYISDAFEVLHAKLKDGQGEYQGADPDDPNEYTTERVFYVPPPARWKIISDHARKTEIFLDNGEKVDISGYLDAVMEAIEDRNNSLKGVLPIVYSRQNLDRVSLSELINIIGTITLGSQEAKSIVNLPAKLFLNTKIPACLWFLSRKKEGRLNKVLFIDARNLGYLINRRTRNFTDQDITRITETYHHWCSRNDEYRDIPGFCKAVSLEEIKEKDYVLTPGRYIDLLEGEDDFDFAEHFGKLKAEFDEQIKEEARLIE